MTIWKFPIKVVEQQIVEMPQEAKILTVQVQYGQPCIWALVNPDCNVEERTIYTVGTGHPASHVAGCQYVGTYQLHEGQLVFHIFA